MSLLHNVRPRRKEVIFGNLTEHRDSTVADIQLQTISDELAIRRVLDEYCLRLELNSFEEWLDLFTDDTTYVVFRRELKGRAEVAAMLSLAPHGLHLGGPARITLNGDSAEAVQSYIFVPTGTDQWNMGWYQRKLVRQDSVWKIAHTRVKIGRTGELAPDEKARKLTFPITIE